MEPLRPHWLQHAAGEAQVSAGAALRARPRPVDLVADLAMRIPQPQSPLERLFAAYLLQRAGWDALQRAVTQGLVTNAEAIAQFRRIVGASEHSAWEQIPARLRVDTRTTESLILATRIREHVDTHATQPLSLASIARQAGASVRRATADFKAHYGLTIHDYVIRRRLLEATGLLAGGNLKIAAIATSVGFRNKASLYRLFKRVFGLSPGAIQRDPDLASKALGILADKR